MLFSCRQKQTKQQLRHRVDHRAISLNNQIILLANYKDNADSCKKALSLLDSATKIDDSCFSCYFNKLIFLNFSEQPEKSLSITNRLIGLKPYSASLYLMRGGFYERMRDTIAAKKDFQKSLEICETVLDTMSSKNGSYDAIFLDKALSLIMLEEKEQGNQLLKQLGDKQKDQYLKEYYSSFINKSKTELLTFEPLGGEGTSYAKPNN
jgi:hypothetical protein